MTAGFLADPGSRAEVAARHMLRRVATPEEVARTILYLASDDASYVTGAALALDGGMSSL